MISMAVYGAMAGTTSGGASVALERSVGWSRQLRLTPLHPMAYVAIKVLTSMTLGLHRDRQHLHRWRTYGGAHVRRNAGCSPALSAWLCSFVFATFGLFVGFLFPAENVMQFVGPLLAMMAMFGGLFIPLSQLPKGLQTSARCTRRCMVSDSLRAHRSWAARRPGPIGSVVFWTLLFSVGAMLLFRRDTTRV